MMSVAGGWFFLMACEMFVLGKRDFRLPGLGWYLQTAASGGDTSAILWGIAAMVAVIVLLDQFVWRPVIAWAEKFKVEQVESTDVPSSWLLEVLRESRAVAQITEKAFRPMRERLLAHFARLHDTAHGAGGLRPWKTWSGRILGVVAVALVLYGSLRAVVTVTGLNRQELGLLLAGTGATFLRVNVALLLGTLWTVPVGVAIGFHPKLARVAQPLVQIAASVPATALFPVVLLFLVRIGGGLG
jgi:NitT/TauT family transport system permease protein